MLIMDDMEKSQFPCLLGFDLNRALGDLVEYNFSLNRWEKKLHSIAPVRWFLFNEPFSIALFFLYMFIDLLWVFSLSFLTQGPKTFSYGSGMAG